MPALPACAGVRPLHGTPLSIPTGTSRLAATLWWTRGGRRFRSRTQRRGGFSGTAPTNRSEPCTPLHAWPPILAYARHTCMHTRTFTHKHARPPLHPREEHPERSTPRGAPFLTWQPRPQDASGAGCPNNCSGEGVCQKSTGICICSPGFTGFDCSLEMACDSWVSSSRRCYTVYDKKLSWGKARQRCRQAGGDLAIVETLDDEDALVRAPLNPNP